MDPESKKLLEDTFNLEKENNKMLRKVRSVQKWGTWWSIFKIIVVIGIAFGAFYFLEPFVNKFIGIWNNVSGSQQQNLNVNPVQDFLKKIGN
jgi:predicted MFS family arabinose efflux permease